jgi:hypothetical protein
MPSTYTSLLRLTLPADGELIGTWGQVVNNGITTLEETAIAGSSNIVMTDANRTLTTANGATDEARNMVIAFTGTLTAQRDIIVPTSSKIYFVRNATTGGFGLNVKTSAGSGVVVPNGSAMLVYCNGTNVVAAISTLVGTGQFLLADGTAAAPSLSFLSDTNTGLYWVSADDLGFATGGLQRMQLDANGTLSFAVPTNAGAPPIQTIAAAGGFSGDFRGRSSDDLAVLRLLNNAYSVQRATFQCDNANGYVGTTANLPFGLLQNGVAKLTLNTAGDVVVNNNIYGANIYVGSSVGSAGTYGISGGFGASMITWGTSAAGAGRLDLYTSGGAAMIFPRVASAVNYVELTQGATGNGPNMKAVGSDANVQFNYYAQGTGSHAFWINNQAHVVIAANPGTNRYLSLTGGVSANPSVNDSFAQGVRIANCSFQVIGSGRPWTGSVTESQGYIYNVALGICNATASANNRIHEWYKDSVSLYGLWISDNTGAATPWIRVTGGQAAGTTAIDFTTAASGGVTFATGSGGVAITGTASSSGTLSVQDTGAAGANIRMIGDGATTPKKFIRVTGGAFQIINDAYSAAPLSLSDAGVMTDIRGLSWARDAGTAGGSAPPVGSIIFGSVGATVTAAFATVNAATTNILVSNTASGTSTAVNAGTWRNLGARDASVGHALWLRTA